MTALSRTAATHSIDETEKVVWRFFARGPRMALQLSHMFLDFFYTVILVLLAIYPFLFFFFS